MPADGLAEKQPRLGGYLGGVAPRVYAVRNVIWASAA